MTSSTGSVRVGFWGIEKSQWDEFLPSKKKVDIWSPQRPCGGYRSWWEADGKVSRERLCISLSYVEKPFNSKVIKSFVPEQRRRQVFSEFLCYLYMCVMDIMNVLRTGMNMSISHIHIWLCNIYIYIYIYMISKHIFCPVGWGCRIHRLLLSRGVRPPRQRVSWI